MILVKKKKGRKKKLNGQAKTIKYFEFWKCPKPNNLESTLIIVVVFL